jgi:MAE_28990/MAE_18760-like HEPN
VNILELSTSTDARLVEVQKLLAHIRKLERAGRDENDAVSAETAAILKGLFFVHLYGALEYAVSLTVQILLQEITKVAVPYSHFEHLMHVVALDSDFQSIIDSGWDSKFPKRKQLLQRQQSSDVYRLNDTVFHGQLQNLWFKTLKLVFEYLCISASPVPERRVQGYIDEIVNHRNEIAHGRSSASTVGRLVSTADLEDRFRAVRQTIDHVIMHFDEYLRNREFIATPHRPQYTPIATVPPAGNASDNTPAIFSRKPTGVLK